MLITFAGSSILSFVSEYFLVTKHSRKIYTRKPIWPSSVFKKSSMLMQENSVYHIWLKNILVGYSEDLILLVREKVACIIASRSLYFKQPLKIISL